MGEDLELPVPVGARVLHIGPHKTGTTSIQGAFHRARLATLAQGVRYAGPNRHPVAAAQAIVGAGDRQARGLRDAMGRPTDGVEAAAPRLHLWDRLVREVAAAPEPRVVISSEWFADADDATIERIVADLGRERVHVVVTVRPLERLLPSQWQQYAMAGFAQPFDAWLESVLAQGNAASGSSNSTSTPSFWRRHRHDDLVRRWSRVVGPDRVILVVADDRDHDAILRAFERLTGLREGTLELEPAGANRSLTEPEIDVVRAINAALSSAGVGGAWRLAVGLFGATAALRGRTPPPTEPRVRAPDWAAVRARAIGAEIAAGLRSSGARVIGDLDRLSAPEAARPATATAADGPSAAIYWAAIVGTALAGVATAAGLARRWPGRADRIALDHVSSARLREVLASRVREVGAGLGRRAVVLGSQGSLAQTPRSETPIEAAALDGLDAVLRAAGLGERAADRVVHAARRELLAVAPPEGPDAAAWTVTAGTAALGIARARGLVPGGAVPRPARRRAVETLDVASVSTPGLMAVLGARFVGRLGRRPGRRNF